MSQFDLFGKEAPHAGNGDARPPLRPNMTLEELAKEAQGCELCHLYKDATQTVFGEGPSEARLMFVGEQPGDQEDKAGRPFVGPAGQLFDKALEDAGIPRSDAYVTNAVKHFKFIRRGNRRIHQKPERPEIEACDFWLERELALVKPKVAVGLGATGGRALLKRDIRVLKERGSFVEDPRGFQVFLTVHPSFLLRVPDERAKAMEYERFVQDLEKLRA